MKILAVDTALGACSVAVLDDGAVRAHRFETMARGHAEALAPMVEAAMAESEMEFSCLDRLAATTGPGTFTGQRVGLAFMRGLRIALGKPLIGVTTLEAMGAQAMAETSTARAAVVHDARRGEVYVQLFEGPRKLDDPAVTAFEKAAASIKDFAQGEIFALAGTAGPRIAAELAPRSFILSGVHAPDAIWVARLASGLPAPDGPPAPLYLRPPDAKLPTANPSGVRPFGAQSGPRFFEGAPGKSARLAGLHAACFDAGWSAEAIDALLAGPGVFALAHAAGFVLARAAAGEAEILTLCVAPYARRQGIGRALLAAAAAAAQARGAGMLFLEVSATNQAALALYSGAGFAPVGERKAYYETGNPGGGNALILRSPLPLSPSPKFA